MRLRPGGMVGCAILAPATFLLAVNGLLFYPPQGRMKRPFASTASTHQCAARREAFDGGPLKERAGEVATPRAPREDENMMFSVDVDKLPTFVVFTAGDQRRQRREDVICGSGSAACKARLLATIASVSPHAGAPEKHSEEKVRRDRAIRVHGSARGNVSKMEKTNSGAAPDKDVEMEDPIADVSTREELRRIVISLREEHRPLVVMYHARWCRTCAHLAPMFRRLARQRTFEGANGTRLAPTFCRVDVSKWGAPYTNERTSSTRPTPRLPLLREGQGLDRNRGFTSRETVRFGGDSEVKLMPEGSTAMENCDVCGTSGFVPCGTCQSKGTVARSSPDGKHTLMITCPACVGYKRLRCPSCGGKCYMCD